MRACTELMKKGGEWLGACRKWLQWNTHNGDRVTWGSNDVIQPPLTARDVEELASCVAEAAAEQLKTSDEILEKLRKKHLRLEMEFDALLKHHQSGNKTEWKRWTWERD